MLRWVWPWVNWNRLLLHSNSILLLSIQHKWKEIIDIVWKTTNGKSYGTNSQWKCKDTLIKQWGVSSIKPNFRPLVNFVPTLEFCLISPAFLVSMNLWFCCTHHVVQCYIHWVPSTGKFLGWTTYSNISTSSKIRHMVSQTAYKVLQSCAWPHPDGNYVRWWPLIGSNSGHLLLSGVHPMAII